MIFPQDPLLSSFPVKNLLGRTARSSPRPKMKHRGNFFHRRPLVFNFSTRQWLFHDIDHGQGTELEWNEPDSILHTMTTLCHSVWGKMARNDGQLMDPRDTRIQFTTTCRTGARTISFGYFHGTPVTSFDKVVYLGNDSTILSASRKNWELTRDFFFENNDTPEQKTGEVCNDGQSMTVAWNVAWISWRDQLCLWRAFHEKAWPKLEILQFARQHFRDETM